MIGVLDAFMDSLFAGTLLETSTGRGQQPDPHREHSSHVDSDDTHVEQAPQQQTQSRVNYGYLHTATTTKTQPETQEQPHKLPDYNAQVAFEPGKQYLAYISLRSVGNATSDVHVPFGVYCDTYAHMHHTQRDTRTHEDVHVFKHSSICIDSCFLACLPQYIRAKHRSKWSDRDIHRCPSARGRVPLWHEIRHWKQPRRVCSLVFMHVCIPHGNNSPQKSKGVRSDVNTYLFDETIV